MLLQIHIGLNFRESWILLRNADGDRTASSETGLRAVGSVSAEQAGSLGEAQVPAFPTRQGVLKNNWLCKRDMPCFPGPGRARGGEHPIGKMYPMPLTSSSTHLRKRALGLEAPSHWRWHTTEDSRSSGFGTGSRMRIPAQPRISCVTSGQWPAFSVPHFTYL